MYSFGAKGMIRVGTPGNVFAIVALPPDAKRDEADFFAVCGGGGSAKTGQFNSVGVLGVRPDEGDSLAADAAAGSGAAFVPGCRAALVDALLTDDRLPAALSVAPDRRSIVALEGAAVEVFGVEPHAQTGGLRSRGRSVVAGPLEGESSEAGSSGAAATASHSAAGDASAPEPREAEVTCAAHSPDGLLLATAAADGLVRIWAVDSASASSSTGSDGPAAAGALRAGVSASSAASAAAAGAGSSAAVPAAPAPSLRLLASLRGSWRPVHVPQPRRQGDRWIYPDDPRRAIALTWLPLPFSAASKDRAQQVQQRQYGLAALNQDGGTVVWSLRASITAASTSTSTVTGPLECLGATALPCLGPRVRGHAGAPRAHRKAPRLAGQRDAGKWWPRAAVPLPRAVLCAADGGSVDDVSSATAAIVHLAVLESSERGGSVLARWSLEFPLGQRAAGLSAAAAGAGAADAATAAAVPSFTPRLPSLPSASAAAAMALDDAAAQLNVMPRALAVAAAPAGTGSAVSVIAEPAAGAAVGAGKAAPAGSASGAGAGAGAARVLGCTWTLADARPAVALALACLPPTKPPKKNPLTGEMEASGEAPPAPPLPAPLLRLVTEAAGVGAGGLLLVGTADNRVNAFEPRRLDCVAASAPLQADAPPMQALAYSPRSGAALAAVGREVVVYPLRHAALRGPAAPSRVSFGCVLLSLLTLAVLAATAFLFVTSPQGRELLGLPASMPFACAVSSDGSSDLAGSGHSSAAVNIGDALKSAASGYPHCAFADFIRSLAQPDAVPAANLAQVHDHYGTGHTGL